MTEIIYPLFLREEGDYFCLIKSFEHLNYQLEVNDVEEFTGWDSTGRPVSLYCEKSQVFARIVSDADESEKLRQSVMRHVERYVSADDSYPDDAEGDLAKMLEWAEMKYEEHWKANRISVRLKNFIKRIFGK